MVSVHDNKAWWESYDWNESGDEWSAPWGGAEAQWFGSLYPRIHRFLPAGEILEIACGYGRWTQYLRDHCEHLTAVDLSDNCIEACRDRFGEDDRLRFIANNGTTIPDVADASIDFAFSFDSLVHVDRRTISAYLSELRRVLKSNGVAFIHHSNLGAYSERYERLGKVPKLTGALRRLHVVEYLHMRDPSVSAEFVASAANDAGLRCIGQELTPWLTRRTLIDCISVIVPDESPVTRANVVVENRQFADEPSYISRVASVYGSAAAR